jgi:hypothetical protein
LRAVCHAAVTAGRETSGVRIRPSPRRRFWIADASVVAIVAAAVLVLGIASSSSDDPVGAPVAVIVHTDTEMPGTRPIPAGFVGFSLEYPAVEAYAGNDPLTMNPVFEQLVRNLGPAPLLRIGGDSADWTWWPVVGVSRPAGVTFTLDQRWLGVTRALARSLGARLILGINLEAASPQVAAAEAGALINGIGASSIRAFELGNEPDLYGTFPWYRRPDGRAVTGRPHDYDFTAFTHDFTAIASALPGTSLAGPGLGGPGWIGQLARFLAVQPRVRVVTVHRYPLQVCFVGRRSPRYPTIPNLLSDTASAGLADGFAGAVRDAHARGLPLWIDELNTVSCGADAAISETFASSLWSLDTLFEMTRVGVDGVNIHTFPGAGYELFSFTRASARWRGSVAPEYYGLLMFARAAPPGSRLLSLSITGEARAQLKVWATRAPDGQTRVVAINKGLDRSRSIAIRVPGVTGDASVSLLQAPSATAKAGVTLGGQSLGAPTTTGRLQGRAAIDSVRPSRGRYLVTLPPASAALVTFGRNR